MVDWRRKNQFDTPSYNNRHQETSTTSSKSQSKKPPLGSWQPTVPLWEKKFCTSVGSIPWGKLVEAKKLMCYYENVVQWNDSAGEEAFSNAKSRYWAEINGLPCDISLPNPDIYIDEIDWNQEIDPELLLDLDREPMVPNDEGKDGNVGLRCDTLALMNHPVPCTGWGDLEDHQNQPTNNLSSGRGTSDFNRNSNEDNPWESNHTPIDDRSRGNAGEESPGYHQWGNNNNQECDSFEYARTGGGWGTWEGNWRKREGASQYMSRYKTSRFQNDCHYQTGGGEWKNDKNKKRVNFVYERPEMEKKHFDQRPWNSIHQLGHNGSGEVGNSWRSWENQVS